MTRLSSVLSPVDLPAVELQAARLDGELYGLADGYCPVGELEGPVHRARAALSTRSPRLIAESLTAAWIWDAAPRPDRLRFAVRPDARARLSPDQHITVRELVFDPGDVVDLDGARATSPLRTIIELARHDDATWDAGVVTRLAAIAGLPLEDCVADLDRRVGIPNKRLALRRLEAVRDQAVDTRYTS